MSFFLFKKGIFALFFWTVGTDWIWNDRWPYRVAPLKILSIRVIKWRLSFSKQLKLALLKKFSKQPYTKVSFWSLIKKKMGKVTTCINSYNLWIFWKPRKIQQHYACSSGRVVWTPSLPALCYTYNCVLTYCAIHFTTWIFYCLEKLKSKRVNIWIEW